MPGNMVLLGRVSDQHMLAEFYSMADVTVITSKRETFSMICAESLCCGTPVVGFKAGGPESICIDEYCEFVEYGNIEVLEKAVTNALSKDKFDNISEVAVDKYKKENMFDSYTALYNRLLGERGA